MGAQPSLLQQGCQGQATARALTHSVSKSLFSGTNTPGIRTQCQVLGSGFPRVLGEKEASSRTRASIAITLQVLSLQLVSTSTVAWCRAYRVPRVPPSVFGWSAVGLLELELKPCRRFCESHHRAAQHLTPDGRHGMARQGDHTRSKIRNRRPREEPPACSWYQRVCGTRARALSVIPPWDRKCP